MQTTLSDYTVANTPTHDSKNRSAFVTVVCPRLSAVSYDPLFHSRHNGRDGTVKVGCEISHQ